MNVRAGSASRNSPFRTMLETSIVRYARALDRTDWSLCLLSLWQLLERLTNTGPQDTYEVTIRRATFKFEDRDFHVEVLRHLKEYRNQFVHHGEISSEAEHMAFQLKYYVDELLNYLIFNPHHLASMPEAAAFMDMAAGSDSLSQKLISTKRNWLWFNRSASLLDKAIAFWEASSGALPMMINPLILVNKRPYPFPIILVELIQPLPRHQRNPALHILMQGFAGRRLISGIIGHEDDMSRHC